MDYLFDAVISLIAVAITYYLVPYLKTKWGNEKQAEVDYWVSIAVSAAEQMFGSGTGAKKLQYVKDFLEVRGIHVTVEEIESAVYWLAESVTSNESKETA